MDSFTFALVVTAAIFHALWNVYAKSLPTSKMSLITLGEFVSGLFLLPFALYLAGSAPWQPGWWQPLAASCVVHALYNVVLGLAYQKGDISLIYPIARGTGIAGTAVLATGFGIDAISPIGVLGILVIMAGIFFISLRGRSTRGIGMALLVGAAISSYSTLDKVGVMHLPPLLYMSLLCIASPLMLMPFLYRFDYQGLTEVTRRFKRQSLGIGFMSTATYLLILIAFQYSQASYVVALREFSIVIASFLGMSLLKEGFTFPKAIGIALIVAGTGIIKLA